APSTNALFAEAEKGIPAAVPATLRSEFEQVLSPFAAAAFATGLPAGSAGIGATALAEAPDGSVLVVGGAYRNQLFRMPKQGGQVGTPLQQYDTPVFNLAFDARGGLWATTGGGQLLQLDPRTGRVVARYGDGLTMGLAIHPTTGRIYVGSGNGVEIFDPATGAFTHFSRDLDLRVGGLAFDSGGTLWATSWPDRSRVVTFNGRGRAQTVLEFDFPIDSLAFGQAGTRLGGLLFVSANAGADGGASALTMVDVTTLRRLAVATGGSRGDVVITTSDGRVLLSQTTQVDVLGPLTAPAVTGTNPPADAVVMLPLPTVAVTFDQDMFVGAASDAASVTNPANYELRGAGGVGEALLPRSVAYDPATRTAVLSFDLLPADTFALRVGGGVRSLAGLTLGTPYTTRFQTLTDYTTASRIAFTNGRSNLANQTFSYTLTVTNQAGYDLRGPAYLVVDGLAPGDTTVVGATYKPETGAWWLDLGLPGTFANGASVSRTITFFNPSNGRITFRSGLAAQAFANQAPTFATPTVPTAQIGVPFSYQASATDPDGPASAIRYFLYSGPTGMTADAVTGRVTWTPAPGTPASTSVTLVAVDGRGGRSTLTFPVSVTGGNRAPVISNVPATIERAENQPLALKVNAADADGDTLTVWADNLPGGATFDPLTRTLVWVPNYDQAGTYDKVTLIASDGKATVS
ncbi:MAG: putative Ig domain-containing protein, partial [Gemmataceae bacterium]|nr:putative Ig domain-containing protein [Gemmataceae bacterium]